MVLAFQADPSCRSAGSSAPICPDRPRESGRQSMSPVAAPRLPQAVPAATFNPVHPVNCHPRVQGEHPCHRMDDPPIVMPPLLSHPKPICSRTHMSHGHVESNAAGGQVSDRLTIIHRYPPCQQLNLIGQVQGELMIIQNRYGLYYL